MLCPDFSHFPSSGNPTKKLICKRSIETITQILSKITHLPSEQIKPRLHTLMESLIGLQEVPFHAKATPEEWSQRFHEWVEGHRELEIPSLSDEAISRENIYGDER